MPHGGALGSQLRVFAKPQPCVPKLVELPAQVFLFPIPARTHRLELGDGIGRGRPRGVSRSHCGPDLSRTRVSVDELGLRLGVEQRVMLMLAVNRDQVATELAELRRIGRAAVDACRTAFSKLALENQGRAARLEHALDGRSLGAVTDLVRAASRTKREAQRIHYQRFPAPGLSGAKVESRPESNAGLGDQGEVADIQLLQQQALISWAPADAPSRASRPAGDRSSPAS
jgi:hypothetical protein